MGLYKKIYTYFLLVFFAHNVVAQKSDYFAENWALAYEMQEKYEIPACLILSVAYVESGGGVSKVGRLLNNHFGIVGSSKPEISGLKSKYKYYPSIRDSYIGFCVLVSSKKYYSGIKGNLDIRLWANSIASMGYAENATLWSNTVVATSLKRCHPPKDFKD